MSRPGGRRGGRRWRWALAALGAGFLALQLFPARRTNPPVVWEIDAPDDVRAILRRACYDCHSHETRWPWYSHVAPVSWWVVSHVEQARGDLDFSDWPAFDPEEQALAYQDIEKQVSRGKMPLRSYTLMHPEARLDDAERQRLVEWAGWRRSGH